LVDVHPYELVGERRLEIAGELHGVGERLLAVIEGMLNAVAQRIGGDPHGLFAESAANGVAAERQRQIRLLAPPRAKIERFDQTIVAVGQLAFMDDQSSVELTGDNRRNDLVEGYIYGLDFRGE